MLCDDQQQRGTQHADSSAAESSSKHHHDDQQSSTQCATSTPAGSSSRHHHDEQQQGEDWDIDAAEVGDAELEVEGVAEDGDANDVDPGHLHLIPVQRLEISQHIIIMNGMQIKILRKNILPRMMMGAMIMMMRTQKQES
jgi:hypothetical protein